jgi:Uma2 family endonuclease
MTQQTVEPRARRWTKAEYLRMEELGFFHGQRVELLDGEVIEVPPMNNAHAVALGLAEDALRAAFGLGHWVRVQMPLDLSLTSEPQPDLAVVPGRPRDYSQHPTAALLVVEVSDTSLAFDRGRKASLYAAARIGDYWIVNINERRLEIRRDPIPDAGEQYGYRFATELILKAGDSAAPLAVPQASVAVAELLP